MAIETKEVTITRTFPASIERLWDAFTTKEDLLIWHAPTGMTVPQCDLDLREGGAYFITMEYEETGEQVTVRGVFREIRKPRKLVHTWKWDGSDEETEVHIFFEEVSPDETKLTLIHRGFSTNPSQVDRDNNWTSESHQGGWTTGLDKLEVLLRE